MFQVDVGEHGFSEGDQELFAGLGSNFQERNAAGFLKVLHVAERTAGLIHNLATDQVRLIVFSLGSGGALLERNRDVGAGQALGVCNRIDTFEFEDDAIAMRPGVLHFHRRIVHDDVRDFGKPSGQWKSGKLTLIPSCPEQACNGNELQKLFQDLQREPPVQLHPCGSQERSDRPGRAALLSDDLAQVGGSDSQLQHSDLLALHFADANLVGYINQRFRNIFNELLHLQAASYSVALWPSILTGIFSR